MIDIHSINVSCTFYYLNYLIFDVNMLSLVGKVFKNIRHSERERVPSSSPGKFTTLVIKKTFNK